MSTKGISGMITGVWRIKWWKYRYVLIATIVVNLLLINQFFPHDGFSLNPFHSDQPTSELEIDTPGLPETTYKPEGPPPATSPIHEVPQSESAPPKVISSTSSTFAASVIESSTSAVPVLSTSVASVSEPAPSSKSKPTPSSVSKPAASKVTTPIKVTPTIPSSSAVSIFNLNDYDFNGEYVGWPLERLCNETEWVPGLTFVCDNNSGGIGNIRNFILTCIRYAIDAGAAELIMPQIQRRSENDLANIFTAGFQPFNYFFDEEHFRWAIKTHCPQMSVHNTVQDIPNAINLLKIEEFYPKDLNIDTDGCDGRGVNRHLDLFRPKFHAWLRKHKRVPTAAEPVTIRFKWATFFEWPIYRDGPEFATTFGGLLRIRKDIQELAAIALAEMSTFAGVKPDPAKFEAPYLGVHLRTESDALNFWPSFDEQSDGYLWQAKVNGLKYAYLACGDEKEAVRFSNKAWNRTQLQVTTKNQLLKDENKKRLDALSWDQQALVDFLMLEKSAHFTGCSFSSFTMNIAFKRHLMTGGINSRQWKSPGDLYSTLVGRFESWYGDWMFMYECMWP